MLGFTPVASLSARGPPNTISSLVKKATDALRTAKVPEAAASAEYLAVTAFSEVKSRHDARLSRAIGCANELERFSRLVKRRVEGRTPIQYLVGNWDFHNITLNVRAPVLIPRPETEELVEHVLRDGSLPPTARVLDIGCGSGAILLALLSERKGWTGVGIDRSAEAVALSRENAEMLGHTSRARFVHEEVKSFSRGDRDREKKFDVVVSNPPYIPARDMASLAPEVRLHEDMRALYGGPDGLDVFDEIAARAADFLSPGNFLWVELDASHPKLLENTARHGLKHVASYADLYGRPRFCRLQLQ